MRAATDLFGAIAAPRPMAGAELIVDSFAGGGGASTGIEMALGRSPDVAINHDAWALRVHAANHPATWHLSKNVWQVDPLEAVRGHAVGLAWFSPDCKHFSKAKGGKPVRKSVRDLAWVVVLWAKRVRPRVIILENVEEFRDWGPITAEGRPCPERKGETFARWVGELRRLGYRVEHRELRACDHGAPTTRKRLFLIARRDGRPIVWPAATHGRPDDPEVIAGRKRPWRTAAEIIDWSLPCPSIFASSAEIKAALGVTAKRPLAEATMARIAKGVWRYVVTAKRPFIVPVTHPGDLRVHSADEPLRTITAARRGELAVVAPALAAPFASYGQQGGASRPLYAPHSTITASPKDTNGLVVPTLVPAALVAGAMVQTGYGERKGQAPRALDVEAPIGTQVAGATKHAVVAAHLHVMRNSDKPFTAADEPMHTITAEGARPALVSAFLAQHNTGVVGHEAGKPLSTITSGGMHGVSQQAIVAAHLQRQFSRSVGAEAGAPLHTDSERGKDAVVAAHLLNLHGGDRRDRAADEPVPTIAAGGNHVAEVRAFLMRYYGEGGQWSACDEPVPTDTVKPRFGLVTVAGVDYQIVDIGMRMLTPRERFDAQGFPASYIIDTALDGRPITAEIQGRLVGNSVCPPMAAALVAANCADLAVGREAAE